MYYPHDFQMKDGELSCEGVPLSKIAAMAGTPVYIYSYKTLVEHVRKLQRAFQSLSPLICFSVKANGNLAILRLLVKEGAGLDIVSGGELFKALRVRCPASRIVYASVGKRPEEIREALRAGIFCFNVESVPELEAINAIAQALRVVAPVALRVNPNVKAQTHRYITTGTAETKFGIDPKTVQEVFRHREAFRAVRLMGVHLHIGSQITQARPFLTAIQRAGELITKGRRLGLPLEWLNIGGGLGIIYKDECPQTPEQFAKAIVPTLRSLRVQLILEPGRFIVGNAGVLLTKVLYVKPGQGHAQGPGKQFVIVDAGMNDLLRPALYGAYHEVIPVTRQSGSSARYDVVGPVCESADVLAKERPLGRVRQGTLLAVLGAGAYGSTMASNYNGRLRSAEVLVRGTRFALIRRRETMRDLIRHDRIPRMLNR